MIHDPDLRRMRAMTMIHRMVVEAKNRKQIAAEFHLTERTVERDIDWAKRQGLLTQAEDRLLNELVPAAMTQVLKAVGEGHTEAALEILKGAGLLRKQSTKPLDAPAPEGQEESLEVYIKRRAVGPGDGGGRARTQFKPRIAEQLSAGATPVVYDLAVSAGAHDGAEALAPSLRASGDEAGETRSVSGTAVSVLDGVLADEHSAPPIGPRAVE